MIAIMSRRPEVFSSCPQVCAKSWKSMAVFSADLTWGADKSYVFPLGREGSEPDLLRRSGAAPALGSNDHVVLFEKETEAIPSGAHGFFRRVIDLAQVGKDDPGHILPESVQAFGGGLVGEVPVL